MKKKIFIICMFFLCLFLFVFSYKFLKPGNNKNIENVSQIDEYILGINNYNVEANITVFSNKNLNTYHLKQYKMGEYQKQEVINDDENYGVIIENEENKIKIKNTVLDLKSVFDNYKEITNNSTGLDSFIEDYKNPQNDIKITEDNNHYLVEVKIKDESNVYLRNKTLFISKEKSQIEKIEVTDVNNNKTIFIEYTRFEIL